MNLEKRVQARIKEKTLQNRFTALFMAFAIITLYIVNCQLIVPGVGMSVNGVVPVESGLVGDIENVSISNVSKENGNEVNDIVYSPKEIELATLLFGSGESSVIGTSWEGTIDEALYKAQKDYFLGLASDFCVFIEGDFTAKEADAEGRVFVGGNVKFEEEGKNWNYQIGSGDFSHLKPLTETEEFINRTNFAHLICGGFMQQINTISTGNKSEEDSSNYVVNRGWHYKSQGGNGDYTVVYNPEDDMYKKFLVGNYSDSKYYNGSSLVPYSNSVTVEWEGNDSNCNHSYLTSVNQNAQIYYDENSSDYIRYVKEKVFDLIRSRSESLHTLTANRVNDTSVSQSGTEITFDGSGMSGSTYYFKLDSWDSNVTTAKFINIPDNVNIIVSVGGDQFNIQGSEYKFNTYISTNSETPESTLISNSGENDSNNNVESSRILYNFYEATKGTIQTNFNGTILAPKADVESPAKDSNTCAGHLSGALIAKSFEGFLEIGYRPYRGNSNILGLTSGYTIPVSKIDEDGNPLSGATMSAVIDGATEKWISSDAQYNLKVASKIDFSGETEYDFKIIPDTPLASPAPKLKEKIDSEPVDENEELNESTTEENVEETQIIESTTSQDTPIDFLTTESNDLAETIEESTETITDEQIETTTESVSETTTDIATEMITESVESTSVEIITETTLDDTLESTIETSTESIEFEEESFEKDNQTELTENEIDEIVIPMFEDLGLTVSDIIIPQLLEDEPVKTEHNIEDLTQETVIKIKEEKPPKGYIGSSKEYTVKIIETVDKVCKYINNGNTSYFPIHVNTKISVDDSIKYKLDITDEVISNAERRRTIIIKNNNDEQIGTFVLNCDMTTKQATLESGNTGTNFIFDSETMMVTPYLGDAYSPLKITNANGGLKIKIKKIDVDSKEPISDVKFDLYLSDGDVKLAGNLETNSEGIIELPYDQIKSQNSNCVIEFEGKSYLKTGSYYLKETNQKEGYKPTTDQKIPFTIGDDLSISIPGKTTKLTQNNSFGKKDNWRYLYLFGSDSIGWIAATYNQSPFNNKLVIEDVVSVHIKSSSNIQNCYMSGLDTGYENLNKNEIYHTFSTPVELKNLEIYDDSNDLTIDVEIVTANGTKYTTLDTGNESESNATENSSEPLIENIEYGDDGTATLVIGNTRDTKSVEVVKEWDDNNPDGEKPQVKVQLYEFSTKMDKRDESLFTDDKKFGDECTLTLDTDGKLKHTWTMDDGLKSGKYYYVKEIPVTGYIASYSEQYDSSENKTTITITNSSTININVEKVWNAGSLTSTVPDKPEFIQVKLKYKENESDTWHDYPNKILTLRSDKNWQGTFEELIKGRIYTVEELKVPYGWKLSSVTETKERDGTITVTNVPDVTSLTLKKEWVNDNSGSIDNVTVTLYRKVLENLSGGYHDAGDHVMFGLPQGFSASTLGWSYYEFKDSYTTLEQSGHFLTVFDRFADFFNKSVRTGEDGNITELLVRKGIPGTEGIGHDHDYWGAPESQYSRATEMEWTTSAPDIASEYAATLAQYYLFHKDDDNTKAEEYLETAKKLYEFAQNDSNRYNDEGYYNSESYADDKAWAAGWLYKATGEQKYKDALSNNSFQNSEWGNYSWNDVGLGASALYAEVNNDWSNVENWLNIYANDNSKYFYYGKWGSSRNNCGAQLIALVAAKYNTDKKQTYTEWAKSQMEFILGGKAVNSNVPAFCYVIGFDPNGNYPKHEHHRAASGTDSMHTDDESEHLLIGGLVGGPSYGDDLASTDCGNAPDRYNDVRWDYVGNEVSLDYNAVLVGAAAGLYDAFKTGITDSTIEGVETVYGGGKGTTTSENYNNYAKLLQYSLYFFDANMCGDDVVENSAFDWRGNCHTDDGVIPVESETTNTPTPQSAPRVARNIAKAIVDAISVSKVNATDIDEEQTTVKPSARLRNMISASSAKTMIANGLFGGVSTLADDGGSGSSETECIISNVVLDEEISVELNNVTAIEIFGTNKNNKSSGDGRYLELNMYLNGQNASNHIGSYVKSEEDYSINVSFRDSPDLGLSSVRTIKISSNSADNFSISLRITHDGTGRGVLSEGETPGGESTGGENTGTQSGPQLTDNNNGAAYTVEKNGKVGLNLGNLVNGGNLKVSDDSPTGFSITDGNNLYAQNVSPGNYAVKIIDQNNTDSEKNYCTVNVTVSKPQLTKIKSTPSIDYIELKSGNSFTFAVEGNETFDNNSWTVTNSENASCSNYFTVNGNTVTLNENVQPGVYTFSSENDLKETSFKIEVLKQGQKLLVVDNINKQGYATSVSSNEDASVFYIDTDTLNTVSDGSIKKIAVKFDNKWNSDGANFGFYLNGKSIDKDNNGGDGSLYRLRVSPDNLVYCVDVTEPVGSVSVKHWWDDNQINISKVYYIYEPNNSFSLTVSEETVVPGETITLTADKYEGDITWGDSPVTKNSDGTYSYTVPTNSQNGDSIEITGTDANGKTGTVTIQVVDFKIKAFNPTLVTKGETVEISIVKGTEGEFTITNSDSESVTVIYENGKIKITGNQKTDEPIEIQVARNGHTEIINVKVTEGLEIKGNQDMSPDDIIDIYAENYTGDVTWTLSDDKIAEIVKQWTSEDGKAYVRIKANSFGNLKVTATDSNNKSASCQIQICAKPSDAVDCGTYIIEKDKNWQLTVGNLPKTDINGNPYYYYIEEETNDGQYVPISYDNGKTISSGSTVLSVKNKLPGSLPSTGSIGTKQIKLAGISVMILAAVELSFKHRLRRRKWSGA